MPAARPLEFRREAVGLARSGGHPVAKIAGDAGRAGGAGRVAPPQPGPGDGGRGPHAGLGAFFARENVLPK